MIIGRQITEIERRTRSGHIQKALLHRGKQVLQLASCDLGVRAMTSVGEIWTGVKADPERDGRLNLYKKSFTKSQDPKR